MDDMMEIDSCETCRISDSDCACPEEQEMTTKPRASFCWLCGEQLWQRRIHVEAEVDGHSRILHKACAKELGVSAEKKRPVERCLSCFFFECRCPSGLEARMKRL